MFDGVDRGPRRLRSASTTLRSEARSRRTSSRPRVMRETRAGRRVKARHVRGLPRNHLVDSSEFVGGSYRIERPGPQPAGWAPMRIAQLGARAWPELSLSAIGELHRRAWRHAPRCVAETRVPHR
jgi:hypothetical protein